MTLALIALAVFIATLLGGFFALRFKDKLHLIVGFSAGAVLGIAFLDLIPEAVSLVGSASRSLTISLVAVLVYMIIDRIFFMHAHNHDNTHEHDDSHKHDDVHEHEVAHEDKNRGMLRAGSLVLHSFLDGLAIGFSFQISAVTGAVVAVAVLAHDFSDGINTVAAILKGGTSVRAKTWLMLDALAPVAGIIVGSLVVISDTMLGYVLSVFAGLFVYIALADMVPESFHAHPKKWTTIMTILGAVFIYIVIHFAHL